MRRILFSFIAGLLLASCGSGDAPADQNASTCYRCYIANAALVQQTYACSRADAQQFGRPCFR